MREMYDLRHYMDEVERDDELLENDASDLDVQKKNKKEIVSMRRKKSYFKSRSRMRLLNSIPDITIKEKDKKVVGGMLRSHQLPISHVLRAKSSYGCSVANKKRRDAADYEVTAYSDTEIA